MSMSVKPVIAGSLRAVRLCVGWILHCLSWCVPRDRERWVFGAAGDTFSDNAKYLFLWAAQQDAQIRMTWISGDAALVASLRARGFDARTRWSPGGVLACLRAKVYVFSSYSTDINFWTSGGAVHVNLWHGIAFKNIEFGIRRGPLAKVFRDSPLNPYRWSRPALFRRPDRLLSTADCVSEHFASCFRIPKERCMELGYPRVDVFFDRELEEAAESEELRQLKARLSGWRRVWVYMPTWRDSRGDGIARAIPDWKRLQAVLEETNSLLIVKAHLNEADPGPDGLGNILVWPSRVDIYPALRLTDGLITDYSSIFFDYLLLPGKEIVFYPYDYDEYAAGDRDFAIPYYENIVGAVVPTFERLLSELASERSRLDPQAADAIRAKFWGSNTSGGACARVFAAIEAYAGGPGPSRSANATPAGPGSTP